VYETRSNTGLYLPHSISISSLFHLLTYLFMSICHAMRYPHKCCDSSCYYTDTCSIRYEPNCSIWDLKIQNFPRVIPPNPQCGKERPPPAPPPARPLASKCPRCWDAHFQKRSPKSKIATTPLILTGSPRAGRQTRMGWWGGWRNKQFSSCMLQYLENGTRYVQRYY